MGQLEQERVEATLATLDPIELEVLRCLVQGMSDRQTAMVAAADISEVSRARVSLMKKLRARTTADAVRNALWAGIGQTA